MAVAIIRPVPRRAACLWSRARAGQEGRSRAGEGQQPWVGSTSWASLMGRQPSVRYVGMQAATASANVRGFYIGCSRHRSGHTSRVATLTVTITDHPHLIFPTLTAVKLTEHKLLVSSAWSGLILVLFVSMFPCFLLLRASKTVFLSSLTSHNALHCYQWEPSLFPAVSTMTAIFPMLSFQKTYLGHWGYQTSWEWKNNSFRSQETKNSVQWIELCLTTLLFLIALNSLFES